MILDLFKLDGKVAVVSGAGKGIGADIAIALAEAGADVVVAARTEADIAETVRQIEDRGRRGLAVVCDVTSEDQLKGLVDTTRSTFGRIDILVNNAGGSVFAPALTVSAEEFNRLLHFNLTSAFLLTKLTVPHMLETAGQGSVINISSGASVLDVVGMAPYGAAKAGMNQMTKILAHEFAPKIRVNGVIVGMIRTPGTEQTLGDEVLKMTASNIPMGRLGEVRDIAAGVVYLASPASAWVTGRMLDIGGGCDAPPLRAPLPPL
jgi:7-alpha-hydroxysteroid dehydrogenase